MHLRRLLVPLAIPAILLTTTAAVAPPAESARSSDPAPAATGTLLREDVGLYPRAIRLEHNGDANGRVLASVVTFGGEGPDGLGAIYESTDDGESFQEVGQVADPNAADGKGLCCATLYELPVQIGEMPAGTLLWAASVGADNRPMSLRIWKSNDIGRTWSYLSDCAVAANDRGLWEPEFSIAADGQLVCHYADETDPAHSQKLVQVRTSDGVNWTDRTDTVSMPDPGHRPGMAMVRRLPNGTYFMSYEICGLGDNQYDCGVHYRTSTDGWSWGDPAATGVRPETADGRYFTHTPTIAWSPGPGPDGRLLLIGQDLENADGTLAAGNRKTVFMNDRNGEGPWTDFPAPVVVESPEQNYCPNYSSPLLPSTDGTRVLEIATDFAADGVCKAYFATGPIPG